VKRICATASVLDLRESETAELVEEFQSIAPVVLENRIVSRQQLDDVAAIARSAIEPADSPRLVAVNYESATIQVGLPTQDAAAQTSLNLTALQPSAGFDLLTGELANDRTATMYGSKEIPARPAVVVDRRDMPSPTETEITAPLRGGKGLSVREHVDDPLGGKTCTAGFVAKGTGQYGLTAGKLYGLTAGHCGGNMYHVALSDPAPGVLPTQEQGVLFNNQLWGRPANETIHADSALFEVAPGATPTLYQAGRGVVGMAAAYAMYTNVCHYGITTRYERCGPLSNTSVDVSMTPSGDGIAHPLVQMLEWSLPGYGGDSGGPLYSKNPDGSAVAAGILTAGYSRAGTHSYFTRAAYAVSATGAVLAAADARSPFGVVDQVVASGSGGVHVSGWTIDPDVVLQSTDVHIYIGGAAGTSGAVGTSILAGQLRNDVASAYPGTGNHHGFSQTVTTSKRGAQPVFIYAIDLGAQAATNTFLWSGNVTIS
jgi:hypothetical protein